MSDLRRQDRGSRRRLKADINVVPYLDVLLVLLVIFMVTAPIVTPGVIDLPSVGTASSPPAKPLEVIIRADGRLELQDRQRGDTRPREIAARDVALEAQRRQTELPDQPVVISADRSVPYEKVLEVMDQLNRQGVKRVGLAVRPASTR